MKLQVYGDIHTEFEPFDAPRTEADVIVLAGDIGVDRGGLDFAADLAARCPVIYVAGNHEFYRSALPELSDQLRAEAHSRGVHFLENEAVVIDGVRFLGCTLWSDFALFGEEHRIEAMAFAQIGMTDYRVIRKSPAMTRLAPRDTIAVCRRSVDWLRRELAGDAPPTVVVTHHAPSIRSIPERFMDDLLSAAFASGFDELVESSGAALWIHGHTHHCVDYRIGNTRVVSNQRGYPEEPVDEFSLEGIFEI